MLKASMRSLPGLRSMFGLSPIIERRGLGKHFFTEKEFFPDLPDPEAIAAQKHRSRTLLAAVLGATSVAVLIIASPSLASSFIDVVDSKNFLDTRIYGSFTSESYTKN